MLKGAVSPEVLCASLLQYLHHLGLAVVSHPGIRGQVEGGAADGIAPRRLGVPDGVNI